MDRRVKERLVGASILVVLVVLIVPELLSGPPSAGPQPAGFSFGLTSAPASQPVRNVTVDLATSKPPAPASDIDPAASSAQPPENSAAPGTMTGADAPNQTPPAPIQTAPAPALVPSRPQPAPSRAQPTPVETLPPAPRSVMTAVKPATAGAWAVQLGSFAHRANADKLAHQLKAQGFSVYVVSGGSGASVRYRVRIGPMADRGSAAQARLKLKSLGHAASFVPPAP
jgi:DedD protein